MELLRYGLIERKVRLSGKDKVNYVLRSRLIFLQRFKVSGLFSGKYSHMKVLLLPRQSLNVRDSSSKNLICLPSPPPACLPRV
jgi:hypothetical protein